jgi:hypothetical protein
VEKRAGVKLSEIKQNERNPRKISPGALDRLKRSIERDPEFMRLRPIVVDGDGMILGGNQRYAAIKALGMAEFRGFAFLEKTGENGQPVKNPAEIRSLQPIEQWFWLKDRTGKWRFDPGFARSETSGVEADLSTLIFREVEDPINEIGIICFIYEALGKKDYAGFIEVFGIPSTFFIAPVGVSSDDMAKWQAMADALMGDQRQQAHRRVRAVEGARDASEVEQHPGEHGRPIRLTDEEFRETGGRLGHGKSGVLHNIQAKLTSLQIKWAKLSQPSIGFIQDSKYIQLTKGLSHLKPARL